uniref:BLUF domain-containing protein n=1 Tax=Lotharella globosa TaxID=91324 RepID=A0A7S3YGY4_9EUKA
MGACSSTEKSTALVRVGYRSTMKPGADIDAIIEAAEKKNKKLGIGGALWYDPETEKVHQMLEGEERAVTKLLDVIIADTRHSAIIMEDMEKVETRQFQEWGGMRLSESPLLKDCGHNRRTNVGGYRAEGKE